MKQIIMSVRLFDTRDQEHTVRRKLFIHARFLGIFKDILAQGLKIFLFISTGFLTVLIYELESKKWVFCSGGWAKHNIDF